MGVIYLRTNKINGKKYVGQATTIRFKERQYKWACLSQPYSGEVINRARAKYGLDAFDFEILKECEDDELDYWEMYYIKELNTKVPYGYNLTDGGEGMTGYTHTAETRKKISECHKGKHRSAETRKKLSESHKGKKFSQETRIKMSESRKGKKRTEETRKKISKSHLNGKCSKPVLQINKETNDIIKEWPSISEVERQIGINGTLIIRCCKNKPYNKSAGGYKWQYK